MHFDTYDFKGKIAELVGEHPAKNTYVALWGKPSSGKSSLCFMLADMFSEYGDVLYVAAEEKIHETLRIKTELTGMKKQNVHFVHLRSIDELKEILKRNHAYSFLIIDSLNKLKIDSQMFEKFKEENDLFIIAVLQSTKDGNFRGSNELAHDADVVISVDEGIATTDKGRFGKGTFKIF